MGGLGGERREVELGRVMVMCKASHSASEEALVVAKLERVTLHEKRLEREQKDLKDSTRKSEDFDF
eukprot:5656483-Karenia_brevis.AAC.1